MVTGATSGIGLVAAQALAQLGATTVLVGRNPEKGPAAVACIQQETGNASVEFMLADLSIQAQSAAWPATSRADTRARMCC